MSKNWTGTWAAVVSFDLSAFFNVFNVTESITFNFIFEMYMFFTIRMPMDWMVPSLAFVFSDFLNYLHLRIEWISYAHSSCLLFYQRRYLVLFLSFWGLKRDDIQMFSLFSWWQSLLFEFFNNAYPPLNYCLAIYHTCSTASSRLHNALDFFYFWEQRCRYQHLILSNIQIDVLFLFYAVLIFKVHSQTWRGFLQQRRHELVLW